MGWVEQLRSLLEHVMIGKVGDHGSFKKNIEAFFAAGHITPMQKDYLSTAVEAGNASTHRAWTPSVKQLNILMNVMESVIQAVCVLREEIDELKSNIPP